jgi:uncharacterized protein DUF4154
MNVKKTQLLAMSMLMTLASCCDVLANESDEYRVKAEYLMNFARFIYWPEKVVKTTEFFNICVRGESPISISLHELSINKVINKNIKIGEKNKSLDDCQVVYFAKSRANRYKDVVNKLTGKPVLTVSDIEGFSTAGGMIEFVKLRNRISFEINFEQSTKSNIKYRTQLLLVAEKLR